MLLDHQGMVQRRTYAGALDDHARFCLCRRQGVSPHMRQIPAFRQVLCLPGVLRPVYGSLFAPTTECCGRSIHKRLHIKRDTYCRGTSLPGFPFVCDRGNQRVDFHAGRRGIDGKGKVFITYGQAASLGYGLAIREQHGFADGGVPLGCVA